MLRKRVERLMHMASGYVVYRESTLCIYSATNSSIRCPSSRSPADVDMSVLCGLFSVVLPLRLVRYLEQFLFGACRMLCPP